jgi:uncharacterized protein YjbI with pentapeptide repeats
VRTRLDDATFERARISNANFTEASLSNTNFEKADFDWISHKLAKFAGADFGKWTRPRCRFGDVQVFSCDFSRCLGLTSADFAFAYGDGSTKLPPNIAPPDFWNKEVLESSVRIDWCYRNQKSV